MIDIDIDDELELTTHPHAMGTDTQIRIAKDQYSVFELLRKEKAGRVVLAPDFQRKDVWKTKNRSELIESILMGIPVPLVYLFEDENGIRQIIDGKQRITALKLFVENKFSLSDLDMLPHLRAKRFLDLDPVLQAKIEDFQINTYVIQPPTPEFVKFNIFERVNRSGVNLNKQEMRHALYQGSSTTIIKNLAETELFVTSTDGSVNSDRMKDRYMVLRFICFYLWQKGHFKDLEYKSDIDSFLASGMKIINSHIDKNVMDQTTDDFTNGLTICYSLLGVNAFRFEPKSTNGKRRPINIGLFEMLLFAFCRVNINEIKQKEKIIEEIDLRKKMIDEQGLFSGLLDSKDYVMMRFELANEITNIVRYYGT
jgi:hypothetical protein